MSGNSNTLGYLLLSEIHEFAGFTPREQRYIRRSIDVAFKHSDPLEFWSRNDEEGYSIKAQQMLYAELGDLQKRVPLSFSLDAIDSFIAPVIKISTFDLAQDYLKSFSAYRFLYERLINADARRWLPSTFCAAAAMPHLRSSAQKCLLGSISKDVAATTSWSTREPRFFPEWVEKVEEDLNH